MEYLKVAEGRGSPKREFKLSRARNQRTTRSNIIDAIAKVSSGSIVSQGDEDGLVRMKILVKKQDLKQMLQVIKSGKNFAGEPAPRPMATPSLSLEQRLNFLRRRHQFSQARGSSRSSWTPALQSIPEEL